MNAVANVELLSRLLGAWGAILFRPADGDVAFAVLVFGSSERNWRGWRYVAPGAA